MPLSSSFCHWILVCPPLDSCCCHRQWRAPRTQDLFRASWSRKTSCKNTLAVAHRSPLGLERTVSSFRSLKEDFKVTWARTVMSRGILVPGQTLSVLDVIRVERRSITEVRQPGDGSGSGEEADGEELMPPEHTCRPGRGGVTFKDNGIVVEVCLSNGC